MNDFYDVFRKDQRVNTNTVMIPAMTNITLTPLCLTGIKLNTLHLRFQYMPTRFQVLINPRNKFPNRLQATHHQKFISRSYWTCTQDPPPSQLIPSSSLFLFTSLSTTSQTIPQISPTPLQTIQILVYPPTDRSQHRITFFGVPTPESTPMGYLKRSEEVIRTLTGGCRLKWGCCQIESLSNPCVMNFG